MEIADFDFRVLTCAFLFLSICFKVYELKNILCLYKF